jgi:ribonuclease-3
MTDLLIKLQQKINIKFKDQELLAKSLVHKSYNNLKNNEKLEFLGDRVLGLVLSKILLHNYPEEKEGIIDKKFANLVNKKTCANVGKKLDIKNFMVFGDSYKNLKRSDDKVVSDCLEAIIGAIFLDKGLDKAEIFILENWKDYIDKSNLTQIDSKTLLQEYSLKKFKVLPKYKVSKQTGPQHNPIFKVEVQIPESKKYTAVGGSKKNAQQNAAKKLLVSIEKKS